MCLPAPTDAFTLVYTQAGDPGLCRNIRAMAVARPLREGVPSRCAEAWRRLLPVMRRCLRPDAAERLKAAEAVSLLNSMAT